MLLQLLNTEIGNRRLTSTVFPPKYDPFHKTLFSFLCQEIDCKQILQENYTSNTLVILKQGLQIP